MTRRDTTKFVAITARTVLTSKECAAIATSLSHSATIPMKNAILSMFPKLRMWLVNASLSSMCVLEVPSEKLKVGFLPYLSFQFGPPFSTLTFAVAPMVSLAAVLLSVYMPGKVV